MKINNINHLKILGTLWGKHLFGALSSVENTNYTGRYVLHGWDHILKWIYLEQKPNVFSYEIWIS